MNEKRRMRRASEGEGRDVNEYGDDRLCRVNISVVLIDNIIHSREK